MGAFTSANIVSFHRFLQKPRPSLIIIQKINNPFETDWLYPLSLHLWCVKVKQILDECDVTPCDEYEFEDYLTILTAHKRNTHYKQMELKLAEEDQDNQGTRPPLQTHSLTIVASTYFLIRSFVP